MYNKVKYKLAIMCLISLTYCKGYNHKKLKTRNSGIYKPILKKNSYWKILSLLLLNKITTTESIFLSKFPQQGSNLEGKSLTMASDQGYWGAGTNISDKLGVFTKYTPNGNTELVRNFDGVSTITRLVEASFEDVILIGNKISQNNTKDIVLSKVSASSNYLSTSFCYEYISEFDDESIYITLSSSNRIFALGNTLSFGSGKSDLIGITIDSDGNFISAKAFGNMDDNTVTDAICSSNTLNVNFDICTTKLVLIGFIGSTLQNTFLAILDPFTNVLENTIKLTSSINSKGASVTPVAENTEEYFFTSTANGLYNTQNAVVGKISFNNIEWIIGLSRTFNDTVGSIQPMKIIEKDDSNIVMLSNIKDTNDLSDPFGDFMITNINRDGNYINSYRLGGQSLEKARTILENPSGNLINFGTTSSFGNNLGFFLSELTETGSVPCNSLVQLKITNLTQNFSIDPLVFNSLNLTSNNYQTTTCTISEDLTKNTQFIPCNTNNNNSSDDDDDEWWESWILRGILIGLIVLCCIFLILAIIFRKRL